MFTVSMATAAEGNDDEPPSWEENWRSQEESAALSEAEETGEPVEILSQRSETSQVFANPDGDFTEHSYVMPQWVRQNGQLVDIDTTLRHNEDGTYSPTATEVQVSFSAGGAEEPLATVVRDGRSMSITWPDPLPRPTVDKDVITYPQVLDGVDLKLQARNGGFGQVLVVHDAIAAANPRLAELSFGMEANGLEVGADDHGNLRAVNPAGQEVFTAPTPLMWDSGTPEDPEINRLLSAAGEEAPSSSDFQPGIGAESALAELRVTDGQLILVPDQGLLTGEDTQYPVYIDPSVEGSRLSWTIAYKKYPNSSFFNGANFNGGTSDARVGYENTTNGTARTFFRMNSKNLLDTNRVITSSKFRIRNNWSWSCNARKVELWYTGGITSATTWNNQPEWRSRLSTVNESKGWGSNCPEGNLVFDATAGAKTAQTRQFNSLTLGLRVPEGSETDVYAWKKFTASSAVLSTTYNTRPNPPSNLDTTPVSTNNQYGCGDRAPYQYIGNTDFYLRAKVSDKDGGTVRAMFHLWPTGHRNTAQGGLIIDKTVSVTSGGYAQVKVTKSALLPYMNVANGNFSWKVQANDGSLKSEWTPPLGEPGCRFVYDPNRPSSPPGVTSTDFPDGSEGWPAGTGSIRQEGSFTLTSGGVNDVVTYRYWTSWSSARKTVDVSAGKSATIKLTPVRSGPNLLYVQSIDRAANESDTYGYLFYATGLKTPDVPGDINGDGIPDIWGIDGNGKLISHYGSENGEVHEAASPADDGDWSNALITHQGDWTGDGIEDLIALRPDPGTDHYRLWVYPNSGFGEVCADCDDQERIELTVYEDTNNHWSRGAKQILAVGDIDGGLDTDGDGVEDVAGFPDLMVNDGEYIWLYYGSDNYQLDSTRDPVLIAGPDDPISSNGSTIGEVTLAAPGDVNNDGIPDLVVAYDRMDDGLLFLFDGQLQAGNYSIDLDHHREIGERWHVEIVTAMAARPAMTAPGYLEIWVLIRPLGELRMATIDLTTDTGTWMTSTGDFTGYRTIS
ncbi:VCBS repeat-containing protein [Streptomyces cheonanensis]|uniref:VCBS repeat-containing protein n=2 Tax=Streptomyces TaxID=1883 RepID=A0ABN2VAD6_9ACTN